MADYGTIQYITGVAGAGVRLSLILNSVTCEAAESAYEVNAISRAVSTFAIALKQVGAALQSQDSVHSKDAIQQARDVAEDCQAVFDEIERSLDKVQGLRKGDGSLGPSLKERFKRCFKRGKVQYLQAQLQALQLNLSLLLQVLQLGKLMAATSKNDTQDEVVIKMNAISQERAETQNIFIVRYWQIHEMRQRYVEAQKEQEEERREEIEQANQGLLTNGTGSGNPQLTIEAAPPVQDEMGLVQMPTHSAHSLEDLDHSLQNIESTREMVRVSAEAVDPLLERWTNWHEIRERRHVRHSGGPGKYAPSVQNLNEDEDESPLHRAFQDREESPKGLYLEGPTHDWRKPMSTTARNEYAQKKKRYSGYQPSVSAESSDIDDSPGSRGSRKPARRHVISDGETDSSEDERQPPPPRARRKSASSPTEKRFSDGPGLAHSYSGPQPTGRGMVTPPGTMSYSTPRPSLVPPAGQPRPGLHHASTSPLPPINTANAPNPYAPTSPYGPGMVPPPYSMAGQRYAPPGVGRMTVPPLPGARPGSSDGKPRSPSRLAHERSYHSSSSSRSHTKTAEEKKAYREMTKKNLKEGATKGLLGAGAIAGFLEALEGLTM